MGGFWSGRYTYGGTKRTTDEYLAIDIRRWAKNLLIAGVEFSFEWSRLGEQIRAISVRALNNSVLLSYKVLKSDSEFKEYSYNVQITRSHCNYGGNRPWFMCPAAGCNRRVAILYGGEVFACRHCYKLAYASQRRRTSYSGM